MALVETSPKGIPFLLKAANRSLRYESSEACFLSVAQSPSRNVQRTDKQVHTVRTWPQPTGLSNLGQRGEKRVLFRRHRLGKERQHSSTSKNSRRARSPTILCPLPTTVLQLFLTQLRLLKRRSQDPAQNLSNNQTNQRSEHLVWKLAIQWATATSG